MKFGKVESIYGASGKVKAEPEKMENLAG